MTKNQIEYSKLIETARANAAQEELTRTRDANAMALGSRQATETERHNRATEGYTGRQLEIQAGQLSESVRHNKATENTALATLQEQIRSHMVSEAETQRSNLAREGETNRSNLAREQETNRSNLARESETKRSNVANEVIAGINAAAHTAQTAESVRHNLAAETETSRHNIAMELKDTSPKVEVNTSSGDQNVTIPNSNQGTRYYDTTKVVILDPSQYTITGGSNQYMPKANSNYLPAGRSSGSFVGRR